MPHSNSENILLLLCMHIIVSYQRNQIVIIHTFFRHFSKAYPKALPAAHDVGALMPLLVLPVAGQLVHSVVTELPQGGCQGVGAWMIFFQLNPGDLPTALSYQ